MVDHVRIHGRHHATSCHRRVQLPGVSVDLVKPPTAQFGMLTISPICVCTSRTLRTMIASSACDHQNHSSDEAISLDVDRGATISPAPANDSGGPKGAHGSGDVWRYLSSLYSFVRHHFINCSANWYVHATTASLCACVLARVVRSRIWQKGFIVAIGRMVGSRCMFWQFISHWA